MNREIEERVQQDEIRHKAKNLNREKKQKQHNDELHEMELNRQVICTDYAKYWIILELNRLK